MTGTLAQMKSWLTACQQKLLRPSSIILFISLNAAVWGLVWLYLKQTTPTYVSRWGVQILGTGSEVDVVLPNTVTARSGNSRLSKDPRADYVYIVNNPAVLDRAAEIAGLPSGELSSPNYSIVEDSAIIDFQVSGDNPTEAQQKAWAIYQAADQELQRLRQSELDRQERAAQETLKLAQQRLAQAQINLSEYRATSGLNSDAQINDLSTGIEQMRRERAGLAAQEQGLDGRLQQLRNNAQLSSSSEYTDALTLQADSVYQQQFAEYGRISAEFADLASQLGPQHPQVLEKKAELEGVTRALQERGSLVLGRQVSEAELVQIGVVALDPRAAVIQQDVFKDMVTKLADRQEIAARNQELGQQITQLEARLNELTREQINVDKLERDLQVAEAVFASTIAKLDLGQVDVYSVYPLAQIIAEPTLPDTGEPISIRKRTAILGGLAGTFLVTTGLLLFLSGDKEG